MKYFQKEQLHAFDYRMHETARICPGVTLAVYNINCFVDKLLALAMITNYTTNYSNDSNNNNDNNDNNIIIIF